MNSYPDQNYRYFKQYKELLLVFQTKFNFTIKWKPPPNGGIYGGCVNNSCNGIMKQLVDHEIDITILDFTHTFDRIAYASPGFTLQKKTIVVYFWKTSNISADFFSILWVLSTEFWLVLIGAIIIFFLALCLTKLLEKHHGFKFLDSLYVFAAIIKAILAQSFDESTLLSSKRPSTKASFSILFFVLSLMGSLIFAVYSGCLISILASDEPHVPFTTTEELANLLDFKLINFGGGSTYRWLKSMTNITKGFDYVLTHYIDPYSFDSKKLVNSSNYIEWLIENKGPNIGLIMENGWLEGVDYTGE